MPDGKSSPIDGDLALEDLLESLKAHTALALQANHAAAAAGGATDAWCRASYPVFVAEGTVGPLKADAFLRIVAYTYSWVAAIPHADPRGDLPSVLAAVDKAKAIESTSPECLAEVREARSAAIRAVQAVLGISENAESVVIVSKVLHFMDPNFAPMIDGNVSKAFQRLVEESGGESSPWRRALSEAGAPRIQTLSAPPRVEQYLSYWELASRFSRCANRVT